MAAFSLQTDWALFKQESQEGAMDFSVYDFSEPREFLSRCLQDKKRRNPSFSLRAWSRQLGYKTPSLLSAVLRGERALKPVLASRILKTLKLTEEEEKYFELIVLLSNAKSVPEKELYLRLLQNVHPTKNFFSLELEQFRLISDWYHLAILEMVDLEDFRDEAEWISRRLGGDVSPSLVKTALERLLKLQLLERNAEGKLIRSKDARIGGDVPSEAIRAHHGQMLEKARLALVRQNMQERDFRGSIFGIRRENLAKAKKLIQRFHTEMHKLSAGVGQAQDIYRFNTQLFRLTCPGVGVVPRAVSEGPAQASA